MGLGKTLTMIALIANTLDVIIGDFKAHDHSSPTFLGPEEKATLIVAPKLSE
jgi:hypothetical protein